MKVGTALNMLYEQGRPDVAVVHEHFAMGDLVEPLGFDSLWALEHHFTGYAMSPAPTQVLAYFAGRTKRISLGTAVIVLTWHDPVRVAEQIRCSTSCAAGAAVRLRPRRRHHRVRGIPHSHGRGAAALRRDGASGRHGATRR
jgi:hypothetical protein